MPMNEDAMRSLEWTATLDEAVDALQADDTPVLIRGERGEILGWIGDREVRRAYLTGLAGTTPVASCMEAHPPVAKDAASAGGLLSASPWLPGVLVDGDPPTLHTPEAAGVAMNLVKEAVLMVGGRGTRLLPLTRETPKPLLPVRGQPILEHILRHLVGEGIETVHLALGYLAEQIEEFVGDGSRFGIRVSYLREDIPLGTAGAIGLLPEGEPGPLLVMNGDILTDISLRAMAAWHGAESAALTVAARPHQHQIPYGVFRLFDARIVSLEEKPVASFWVNAGIYLMRRTLAERIPKGRYLDMTTFIQGLVQEGESVCAFPLRESWCDIGLPEDYDRVNREDG